MYPYSHGLDLYSVYMQCKFLNVEYDVVMVAVYCVMFIKWMKCWSFFIQGFEGTLVWQNLDSAGLSTVNSSSVQLSDGGGALKISSVCTDVVSKINKEYCLIISNVRKFEQAKMS